MRVKKYSPNDAIGSVKEKAVPKVEEPRTEATSISAHAQMPKANVGETPKLGETPWHTTVVK